MKHSAIKENHLYNKVFRRGDRFIGKLVTVHILTDYAAKKRMLAHPLKLWTNRVGLSVSKKLGGAVPRNRAKRIIRAALHRVETETPLKTGKLIVIGARDDIVGKTSQDVYRELSYAFRKLDMIQK
ncbi:MAG: ribonuclease P protein component [Clostridia bacterium]|nr:ribonuclease P protein component [Clostridia bacterium]